MKIGIGALARATGIPVNTLRTWERRYQMPAPVRSEGGQRLYDPTVVEHLKRIALALDRGHRPAQIMRASPSELVVLLGESRMPPPARLEAEGSGLFEVVLHTDGAKLRSALEEQLASEGPLPTIQRTLVPLLREIGVAWEEGQLMAYQEHFASELIQDVLSARWRPQAEKSSGPLVICATLPQERHQLGLHFGATILAEAGWRVLFIGADTPISDIEACVHARRPEAVLLSISVVANPTDTRWVLEHLKRTIPGTQLILGGPGAPDLLEGAIIIQDFEQLLQWARDFVHRMLPITEGAG